MARIRTIKPEFFKNEKLAELPATARLLFIGLFCLSDCEGRLEDRPKRIKAEIFPYETNADVDALLSKLHTAGFIERYEVGDQKLIQVVNFLKHQRITGKEALSKSEFPQMPENTEGNKRGNTGETTGEQPGRQEGKGKEGKGKDIPKGIVGTEVPTYASIEKNKRAVHDFIKEQQPKEIEPYVDFWNFFAHEKKLPQVSKINQNRRKKFSVRIKDPAFNFIEIIRKAATSEFILTNNWFTFDWILENETNFLKVLEGKYDSKTPPQLTITNGKTIDDLREEKDRLIRESV